MRRLAALGSVSLLALLAVVAPAHALTASELYVKQIDVSEQRVGEWQPLDGARLTSLTGYAIGLRLQAVSPGKRHRVLLRMTAVPDGHPDQPKIYSLCVSPVGAVGTIQDTEEEVRFEGAGTYSLSAVTSEGTDLSTNCQPGIDGTASFTSTPVTTARLSGTHLLDDPRDNPPRSGIDVATPLGAGTTDVHCARDPRPGVGGDLTGSVVVRRTGGGGGATRGVVHFSSADIFSRAGDWSCVARAASGTGATAWTAATPRVHVNRAFIGLENDRFSDAIGPVFRYGGRIDRDGAGGVVTISFRQPRCLQGGPRRRTVRVRARVARDGRVSAAVRLPLQRGHSAAGYLVDLSFGGTRLMPRRTLAEFTDVAQELLHGRGRVGGTLMPCAFER